jgi:lipid II:glycine glycyltransferase (peptidoglycan interpeptide bridge formation enzyme)
MTTSCIFQTDWFLEAAAPNSWGACEVEKDGKVIARLPYVTKQKRGLKMLITPPFVHALGPWTIPSSAKYAKQLSQQKELIYELIEQLPPHDYFFQKCHHSFTNWLPFHWKGFTQTTAYTYILSDLTDRDKLWSGFQENIRREIRKAEKQLTISTSDDIDLLYKMCGMTFDRQGLSLGYHPDVFRSFDKACAAKQNRRIFVAQDSEGRIHGAVYIVWDDRSAYYLAGGSDPELRTSGAASLLIWEAIQFAATVSQSFDFVGSMAEPIERFFRGFGARQTPYFVLTRQSRRMKALMAGRDLVNVLRSK